jgi:hypothetical protein
MNNRARHFIYQQRNTSMKFYSAGNYLRSVIYGFGLLVATQVSHAISYRISVDTSPLAADPGAPFAIDFLLIGGDPLQNSVTIGNFQFGGGQATNAPAAYTSLGASGDLNSSVFLTTTEFLNEFYQGFQPGASFTFDLQFDSHVNSPTPDGFSFSILDSNLFNIQTNGVGDSLMLISFDNAHPLPEVFASNSGVSVSFAALPDTGATLTLLAAATLGMVALRRKSSLSTTETPSSR